MSMVESSVSPRKRRAIAVNTAKNMSGGGKKTVKTQDFVLEDLIASTIIRHGYPLTFSEKRGNKDIFTYLDPNISNVSREVSKAHCLKVYEREKEVLQHTLACIPGKVCLTCAVWTDPCTLEYLCLTLNYVDSNWKLQSKFLNLVRLPYPFDSSILQSKVYDLLCEWGIEKKVFTITLDSKRCGDAVADMLRDRLNKLDRALFCNGEYFHVRCGAHFMDNMVQECFKAIQIPIRKIREGVQYVVSHEKKRLKFEEAATKIVGNGVLKPLWLDYPDKWNSTYLMLTRAIEYRGAFENVMIDDEHTGWHLTEKDWYTVEKICDLLYPLFQIAVLFHGTVHPTANLYYGDVLMTGIGLKRALEDEDPVISNLAQRMKVEFDEYWVSCSTVLALATIFDPRLKFSFIKFTYQKLYDDSTEAESKYLHVYNKLDRLFKAYREQRYSAELKASDFPEFIKWEMEEELKSSKSKLDVYLDEPRLSRNEELDVLSWWEKNVNKYPRELTRMARDILSIPITSFPKDSVFGMGYRVENRLLQGSWSSNCTEALIAARNWLYGYEVDEDFPRGLMGLEQDFSIQIADEDESD